MATLGKNLKFAVESDLLKRIGCGGGGAGGGAGVGSAVRRRQRRQRHGRPVSARPDALAQRPQRHARVHHLLTQLLETDHKIHLKIHLKIQKTAGEFKRKTMLTLWFCCSTMSDVSAWGSSHSMSSISMSSWMDGCEWGLEADPAPEAADPWPELVADKSISVSNEWPCPLLLLKGREIDSSCSLSDPEKPVFIKHLINSILKHFLDPLRSWLG